MSEARASESKPILLRIPPPSGMGRWFEYRQGRVFEPSSPVVTLPWPEHAKMFPKPLLDNGDSSESLLKFAYDKKATSYFDTDEGKQEMAKILEVVASAKAKLIAPSE